MPPIHPSPDAALQRAQIYLLQRNYGAARQALTKLRTLATRPPPSFWPPDRARGSRGDLDRARSAWQPWACSSNGRQTARLPALPRLLSAAGHGADDEQAAGLTASARNGRWRRSCPAPSGLSTALRASAANRLLIEAVRAATPSATPGSPQGTGRHRDRRSPPSHLAGQRAPGAPGRAQALLEQILDEAIDLAQAERASCSWSSPTASAWPRRHLDMESLRRPRPSSVTRSRSEWSRPVSRS